MASWKKVKQLCKDRERNLSYLEWRELRQRRRTRRVVRLGQEKELPCTGW